MKKLIQKSVDVAFPQSIGLKSLIYILQEMDAKYPDNNKRIEYRVTSFISGYDDEYNVDFTIYYKIEESEKEYEIRMKEEKERKLKEKERKLKEKEVKEKQEYLEYQRLKEKYEK